MDFGIVAFIQARRVHHRKVPEILNHTGNDALESERLLVSQMV
jgi:hypothetical protein